MVVLAVGSDVIETTREHPFCVVGCSWIEAEDLQVGYTLETADGIYLPVDKIHLEHGPATVYNFEVTDAHDYFVSHEGVLVHNAPCTELAKANRAKYLAKGVSEKALGPSGRPKIHRVKNLPRKKAIDAPQAVTGKGRRVMHHPKPMRGIRHIHGVRKGGKVKSHFEY